jgi:predicted GNAT superfamily acetyltransferase
VLIRPYDPADLVAIHAINQAEVPAVGSETAQTIDHIATESTVALVAEFDSEIAGFCLVLGPDADYGSTNYSWFSERYDDFIYLDRVAISPAHQRRGIGRLLYVEVERLVSERRPTATDFTLEVNLRPRNDQSLGFHANLGFVEVGQRETAYGTLVSLMSKRLQTTPR